MAEYLVLIYADESRSQDVEPEVFQRIMAGHGQFQEKHGAAIKGGNALQSTGTATSLRENPAGGFSITDGAFAETKEALGGYYLIEAADLDEALRIAKDVPAPFGGLEVRPIRIFD